MAPQEPDSAQIVDFSRRPFACTEVRRSAIPLNGAVFNTQRMVARYESNAYFPEGSEEEVCVAGSVPIESGGGQCVNGCNCAENKKPQCV